MLPLLFLGLLVAASAGPLNSGFYPKCSTECAAATIQKLSYLPSHTYTYEYSGKSKYTLKGSSGAEVPLEWKTKVDLTWVSPCDVAVTLREPVMLGNQGDRYIDELLTKHPLMVSISEGLVTGVCAHPHDDPTSLNLKKAVISAIQNTLPSISKIHSGKTFIETDISGKCPTTYEIEEESSRVKIIKHKNHKKCEKRYGSASESAFTAYWLKTPLPVEESYSVCKQYIEHGIVTLVTCRDKNIVKPMIGSYKYVEAVQESELKFLQKSSAKEIQPFMPRYTNLTHEYVPKMKTEMVIPEVETLLKEVCETTESKIGEKSAKLMAELIGLLYRVPEPKMKMLLDKIRSGSFCSKSHRLENLFLDAIAFVGNAGGLEIMVEDIIKGTVTGGRTLLYTIGISLYKRPCINAIKAITPLFEAREVPSPVILAAGNMLHLYCKQHPYCHLHEPVQDIMQKMARRIESCPSTSTSYQTRVNVLAILKAVGNTGNMTSPLEESVLRCLRTSEAELPVRVAAAQAFRRTTCKSEIIKPLVEIVLSTQEKTEVRIAAYKSVIRCVSFEEVSRIVKAISNEHNTQVRSFILSHLLNLQKTEVPYYSKLRYILSPFDIPEDYPMNPLRVSRNYDLSYYLSSYGLGAGVNTDVIFTPGSYIPRNIETNITANIFNEIINIGEFGLRLEDIESLIEMLIGPEGYLINTPIEKIIQDINKFTQEKGEKIKEHLSNLYNKRTGSVNMPSINNLVQYIMPESTTGKSRADMFMRVFGREILFGSFAGNPREIPVDKLIERVFMYLSRFIVELAEMRVDTARTLQLNYEYFIPTIQGIPLQLKYVSTAVAGLKATGSLNIVNSDIKLIPGISIETEAFVGFALGGKAGQQFRSTIHSSTHTALKVNVEGEKVEVKMDMPSKAEILTVKGQSYLTTKMPSQKDKILSIGMNEAQITGESCSRRLKSALGLNVCYKYKVPKIGESKYLPLAPESIIKIYLEKETPSKEVILMKAMWKLTPELKNIDVIVQTPCAQVPTKLEAEIEYKRRPEFHSLKTYFKTIGNQVGHTVKVDLETKRSHYFGKYDMTVFVGESKQISTNDKVITLTMAGRYLEPEVTMDFALKTMNKLEKYIKTDIEIRGDVYTLPSYYYLPQMINLRKLEIDIELMQKYKTQNYIRKLSPEQYEMLSSTSIEGRPLLVLSGEFTAKGSLERKTLVTKTILKVKTERHSYMTKLIAEYTHAKKMIVIETKNTQMGETLFLTTIVGLKQAPQMYKILGELEVPKYVPRYELEGTVNKLSEKSYDVKLTGKKEKQPVFEIEGPITVELERTILKQKADLMLRRLTTGTEYRMVNKLIFTPEQKQIMVEVEKNKRPVILVDGVIVPKGEREFSYTLKTVIPRIIEGKVMGELTTERFEYTTNIIVLPETESKRRIKSTAHIDMNQKEVTAKILYDADRDQSKMMSVNAHYDISVPRRYISVKGDLILYQKIYRYNMETMVGIMATPLMERNVLKVEFIKPSNEAFKLETICKIRPEGGGKGEFETEFVMKTFKQSVYKLETKFTYELMMNPLTFVLSGRSYIQTPSLLGVTVEYKTRNFLRPNEKEIMSKIEMTGPSIGEPLKTEIKLNSAQTRYSSYINIVKGSSPITKLSSKGRLIAMPEGKIREVSMEIEVVLSNNKHYSFKILKTESGRFDLSLIRSGTKVLACEYSSPREGTFVVKIVVPSRTMEMRTTGSTGHRSIEMYLDKERSSDRYAASLTHKSGTSIISGYFKNIEGRLSYPGSQKELRMSSSLTATRTTVKGIIELDVFRTPEEKIVLDVVGVKLAPLSYKVEASIKVPSQSIKPTLIGEISLAPSVKTLELILLKDKSASPVVRLSMGYTTTTLKHTNVQVLLVTPGSYVEFTGVVQKHEMSRCLGRSINGTLHTSMFGSYDVVSAVCAPLYIEIGAKKMHTPTMHMVKIGMRNPRLIKFAIEQVIERPHTISTPSMYLGNTLSLYTPHQWMDKKPILTIGTKLVTPLTVSVKTQYDTPLVKMFVEKELKPAMEKASEVTNKIIRDVSEELREYVFVQSTENLAEELKVLLSEIRYEVRKIYYELRKESLLPEFEITMEKFERLIGKLSYYYTKLSNSVERIIEEYIGVTFEEISRKMEKLDRKIMKLCIYIKDRITSYYYEIKEGRTSTIPGRFVRYCIRTLKESSIWEYIMKEWHILKEKFSEEIEVIKHILKKYMQTAEEDLKKIWKNITKFVPIGKIIDWIKHFFNGDETIVRYGIVKHLITKFYGVYITRERGFVTFFVPLQKRVASLPYALLNVGIPYIQTLRQLDYQSYVREEGQSYASALIPMAYHTAKMTPERITTFDGTVIPLPERIPCKVILSQISDTKITITKETTNLMLFNMVNGETNVEVKMMVDKQQVMINDEPMEKPTVVLPGMKIIKLTHNTVKIVTNDFEVLLKNSIVYVKAKLWTFNKIEGLMGINNNERATDVTESSGVVYRPKSLEGIHHVTPSTSVRLLNKWKMNRSCQIPKF